MDVLKIIVSPLLFFLILTGCQITYLFKSAYNQMNILYNREPIEKILQDPNLTPEYRKKLEVTQRARQFSLNKLNLNVGKNYSTFVQLKKPYVVWAVNASPKWRLEHFLWHFPIIGAVPYKGFPNEQDAKEEATQLQNQGFDTFTRGVGAYSTLGWFSDPILSSMMRYTEEDLVNTIIHESVHATLYIKSNADFNERLASFVGNKGTELFYLNQEGPESSHLIAIKLENEDQSLFSKFISDEIKKLTEFYNSTPTQDLSIRELQFEKIKKRFIEEIKPKLKTKAHEGFEKMALNNARLLLFKTYEEDLSDFQNLLDASNGDLVIFLEKAKTLESTSNPVDGLKNLIKK